MKFLTNSVFSCIFHISIDLKRDLDSTKKKYNEVSDKLSEKNRQHQKLQVRGQLFKTLLA